MPPKVRVGISSGVKKRVAISRGSKGKGKGKAAGDGASEEE